MAILILDKLDYLTRCFKANKWGHFINIKVPVKTGRHGSPKYLNSRKNKNYIRSQTNPLYKELDKSSLSIGEFNNLPSITERSADKISKGVQDITSQ